jgi:hypothetical protein
VTLKYLSTKDVFGTELRFFKRLKWKLCYCFPLERKIEKMNLNNTGGLSKGHLLE